MIYEYDQIFNWLWDIARPCALHPHAPRATPRAAYPVPE